MRVFIFFLFIIVGVLFLPDAFIYTFVKRFTLISSGGEYAMNNFKMTILLIKTLASAPGLELQSLFSVLAEYPLIKPVTCPLARKS